MGQIRPYMDHIWDLIGIIWALLSLTGPSLGRDRPSLCLTRPSLGLTGPYFGLTVSNWTQIRPSKTQIRPSTAQLDLLRLINKQPIKPSDVRPTKAQKGPVGHSMAQKMGQLCPVRPSEAY